jgi:hypothetical protein
VSARPRVFPASAALVAIVALATGAAGCKRQRGASTCDKVGARFLELARADLAASPELDAAHRRGVTGLLAPMRDSMVRACREDGWATDARACFTAAADVAAFRACEDALTAPQRELLRTSAAKGLQAAP